MCKQNISSATFVEANEKLYLVVKIFEALLCVFTAIKKGPTACLKRKTDTSKTIKSNYTDLFLLFWGIRWTHFTTTVASFQWRQAAATTGFPQTCPFHTLRPKKLPPTKCDLYWGNFTNFGMFYGFSDSRIWVENADLPKPKSDWPKRLNLEKTKNFALSHNAALRRDVMRAILWAKRNWHALRNRS